MSIFLFELKRVKDSDWQYVQFTNYSFINGDYSAIF